MKHAFFLLLWTTLVSVGFTASTKNMATGEPPAYKIKTVVIDPGHGGKDPGTLGSHSQEKDVVLKVAKLLGGYIKQYFPDIKVIYTRTDDTFVKLEERAAIANRNKADLFISLHCNAAANKQAYGTETWVMGMHKSETNLEVAKRENSVILLEEDYKTTYEYDPKDPLSHIVFSLYQNAYISQSLTLADYIQYQFRERVNRRDRGVHQAGFVVLYRATMPAVLVEMGFLSNAAEERFLTSSHGQDLVASGIFRAFRNYKEQMEGAADNLPDQEWIAAPEETPPPTPTHHPDEVVYRIQVAVRSTMPDYSQPPYDAFQGFYHQKEASGLFRVFYGHFNNTAAAGEPLKALQKGGFPDAFVVAYKAGKRVDPSEVASMDD